MVRAIYLLIVMLCFISCDEDFLNKYVYCTPAGYEIIFDDYGNYTWRIKNGTMFPVMYKTKKEAVESVTAYSDSLLANPDMLDRCWTVVSSCTDLIIDNDCTENPQDKHLIF